MSEEKIEEIKQAYRAGLDSFKNGVNEINCDFRLFSSPQKTKAWEWGKDNKKFSLNEILKEAL